MNSKGKSLYNILKSINSELVEKNDSLKEGLDIKIKRNISNYTEAVKANCNYILSRNNYKAFKNIERYVQRKEKLTDDQKDKWGFIETY